MKHIYNLSPSEDDILKIRRKLQDYNSVYFEIKDEPNFIVSEIDENNEIIGGIVCTIVGQWLEIDFLWVKENQRGKGLGKILLSEAEEIRQMHSLGSTCAVMHRSFSQLLEPSVKCLPTFGGYTMDLLWENFNSRMTKCLTDATVLIVK